MLLCVVSRAEITKLKELVVEVDPEAFVVLSDVREYWGRAFRRSAPLVSKENWLEVQTSGIDLIRQLEDKAKKYAGALSGC